MITEKEKHILTSCGWTTEQMQFNGFLNYKISSQSGSGLAQVKSGLNDNEIKIQFSVPDKSGETILFLFDRTNQSINPKSDKDIKNDVDLQHFLSMVKSTVEKQKGVFLPIGPISEDKKIQSKNI